MNKCTVKTRVSLQHRKVSYSHKISVKLLKSVRIIITQVRRDCKMAGAHRLVLLGLLFVFITRGYVQYSEPSPYLFSKCYSYSSLSVWSAKRLFRSSLSFSRRQGYQGARCRSHFSVLILLLLLSGDVESNPGPSGSPGVVRCICDSKVESGRMVECSSCRFWVHSKCIKLPSATAPETPFSCCYCIHSSVRGFRALSSFSSSLSSLLKRNSSAIDSAVCSLSQLSCSDEFPELHVSLSALKTSITALLEALHHLDSYPSSSCPSPLSLSHSQPLTSLPSTAPT